jgi:HK97 gp10 family phage protein
MIILEVTGIQETFKSIDKTIAQYEKDVDETFKKAGKLWEKTAKSRARVRTGRMKNSIQYIHTSELGITGGLGIVPVYYAKWIEFGTRRNKAYPFVLPAFEIAKRYLWTELRKL